MASQGRDRSAADAATHGLHLLAEREAKRQERKRGPITAIEPDKAVREAETEQALSKIAEDPRHRGQVA